MTPQRRKLAIVTSVIRGFWIMAWSTGLAERFTVESARRSLVETRPWGIVVFTAIFAGGQLLRVPSTVFVAAAVAAYGRNSGIAVALLGGVTSATVSFAAVRLFARDALSDIRQPPVQRLLRNIDRRPILTVALLRLLFQTAPPLNYALPMTAVRWRDHLAGSLLGLPAPVVVMACFFQWLLRRAA